ncbi:ribosome hibernation-promoting factor, HPF/YfiA family [Azospirillum picis]|uniref:Ribosome hibernation promoting factor n=1 Tax=Azospirillum picis TaxID=488438 RepID=A0ABU0MK16_9PROT|nr:ribosome-associated translation inhibitor RaiA [Azospirillum picis]MBP2299974.1 ribosomal subunit interface protein [Azospirillum picis]MDQ0533788.1 ribosomal subunit interface protein [Azospirillum picis]
MQLSVKGKQLDVGDALRTHVADSLNAVVGKYFDKPIEATVILTKDAHLYKADIQVHVGRGIMLQSGADATEPYPAFDLAAEKLAKRLRRYKRRLRDHHSAENGGAMPARYQILEAEREDSQDEAEAQVDGAHQPMVVAEMETSIPTLSVSEAVMRLELAQAPAMMFHNGAHGRLNMVYRRADGNIGWVDPAGKAGA